MSVSQKVSISGSVSLGPPCATAGTFPSLTQQLSLQSEQTRGIGRGQTLRINSPSAFVDLFASLGVGSVTLIALRVVGGALTLRYSTADGVDQRLRVSRLFIWDSPDAGSGMTALAVQGTADIEIILAGDPP